MRILTPTHCYRALLLGTVLLLSPACKEKPENGSARTGPIRVGVLPDRSPESLRRTYGPLVEFLEEHSGLELDLWLPGDYQELTAAFDDGRVDVARFGGVTFVQAERDSGARPLVLRDVDLNFTTDFLVAAATAEGRSLADFKGKKFSFGPRLSTSGHLMPRSYLNQQSIEPESHFSEVHHSRGHEESALWVEQGVVDIAAVNSVVVEAMIRSGRLSLEKVRVLERSTPYSNYVWATHPTLDSATANRLRDAFLALDSSIPDHATILVNLGSGGYLPAGKSDHDMIRKALDSIGRYLKEPSP